MLAPAPRPDAKLMGCLGNLVGFSLACRTRAGAFNLSEFGIGEKELADYLSEDYKNEADFLDDRILQAERQVQTDILTRYQSRIRPFTFVDRGRIGEPDPRQELLTATAGTSNGVILDVCAPQSNVRVNISRMELWANVTQDVVVQIHDLTDGTLIHTETIAAVTAEVIAKETSISIPLRRRRARFFVTHTLDQFYNVGAGIGGCSTCYSNTFKQGVLQGYGARITTGALWNYANVTRQNNTGGLGLTVSVECDHAAWLCEHSNLMALPMGLKVAELSVDYGYWNFDRINSRATLNREALNDRRKEYGAKYADAMNLLWGGMPLPTDTVCFDCRRTTMVVNSPP